MKTFGQFLNESDYDEEENDPWKKFRGIERVRLHPDYADSDPKEIYTLGHSSSNGRTRWIGDKDGRGWYASPSQLIPVGRRKNLNEAMHSPGVQVVHESPKHHISLIHTHEALTRMGAGSKWPPAHHEGKSSFDQYHQGHTPFVFLHDKTNGEKFLGHPQGRDWTKPGSHTNWTWSDHNDNEVPHTYIRNRFNLHEKGIKALEESNLNEVAAPGQEAWIHANKARFKKEYGEKKGLEVLYATSWKRSKKGKHTDHS